MLSATNKPAVMLNVTMLSVVVPKRLAKDKHSSLLRAFVNYGHKKSYNIGPRTGDLLADKLSLESRVRDSISERLELKTQANDLLGDKLGLESRLRELAAEKLDLEARMSDLISDKLELEEKFEQGPIL
jgi:hypothetical protein